MSRVHYSECPVCSSRSIDPLLTVKDHSVSKENFVIWQCRNCSLRFTQDVPDEGSIGSYYQSADYISHSNTNKGLLNKLYQRVRKITLGQKADFIISKTSQQGNLLDVGAGIGAFADTMKKRGWKITGLEPDEGARSQARQLFHLDLQTPDILNQLPRKSFDAITLWHVMEHVHSLHNYIETMKELLSNGGKIFIAVPNYTSLDSDIYKTWWAAYDVPRHLYHFSPKSVSKLVEQHGLKVSSVHPMWFDSFYISLLSSKYRSGKLSWIGAAFNGLRSNINTLFNKERCSSVLYVVEKV
jgi:2-polyprenyl-3-methyl-5-hydroxy-6-metoxy-1,4-benzoquinol methylase